MYLGEQSAEIIIADKYILKGLHHVEIKKSVHQVIQTAKLELPLSVVTRNSDMLKRIKLSDKINEGDSISIAFGYDGKNNVEFTGYIKRTNYAMPFVLECEDELYLLRKLNLKKSFKQCTLKELLTYVVNEMNKVQAVDWVLYDNMPEFNFFNFLIKNATGIDVLTELKDKYLLNSFLTTINGKKVLYCGLMYGLINDDVKYVFNKNTINTNELKYNASLFPKQYKITIKNGNRNGTTTTIETGDKNGEQKTFYYYGNHTEPELKIMAQAELQKISGNGYKGNFETFLFPYTEPCKISVLTDPQFSDRGGKHYTGTVTTTFGVDGGRRKPEIDHKII